MEELSQKLEGYKLPIGLILVGVVLIIGGLFLNPQKSSDYPKESIVEPQIKTIKVDISGEVINPGVYELEEGSRVEDLISKAGGLTPNANQEFIAKNVNQAQKLVDAAKYYIPKEGEDVTSVNSYMSGSVAGTSSQIVNINSASQKDLESLPGIGPVTASNIIQNRPFTSVDELVNKKIVNKSTFEKIKSSIVAN